MAKARVYEVAKELGIDSKTAVGETARTGEFVKVSPSSTIEAQSLESCETPTRTPCLRFLPRRLPPRRQQPKRQRQVRRTASNACCSPCPNAATAAPAAAPAPAVVRQPGSTGSGSTQTRSACCTSNLATPEAPAAAAASGEAPKHHARPVRVQETTHSLAPAECVRGSASRKQSVQQWRKLRHATPRCARRPTSQPGQHAPTSASTSGTRARQSRSATRWPCS